MDWAWEILNFFDEDPVMDLVEEEEFNELMRMELFPRKKRMFRECPDCFSIYDDNEFLVLFHLPKYTVKFIINKIKNQISSQTDKNYAISAELKVLFTLQFYTTDNFYMTCGDFTGISKASGCQIIKTVTQVITALAPHYINFPITEGERNAVAQ